MVENNGDQVQKAVRDAVEVAKKHGASASFAAGGWYRSVSYKVRDGKLEEAKESLSTRISIRLFVDGRYSSHATTDLRTDRLDSFVREAIALTRALEPDKHRELAPAELYPKDLAELDLVDKSVFALDRDDRLAWANGMNEALAGKPQVISATSGVGDSYSRSFGASSNGFDASQERTSVTLWSEVALKDEDDKRPSDWDLTMARHIEDLGTAEGVARGAMERARGRLSAQKGATQRTTMVVEPRAAGSILGRLLGPANGQSIQQEQSFWKGRLGTQQVSEHLTLVDDPLIKRGLGSSLYDDEGIASRQLPLIERGAFKNIYVGTYYGSKLGIQPTTGSSSNITVALGDRGFDDLIADAGTGVCVKGWLGGNMDPTTGDFSFGVRGDLIESGRLTTPVSEMNITGNIVELFGNLVAVGNDPFPYASTRAPTLVFDDVQFSGT